MESHQPSALVLRLEPVFHYLVPDLARSAVFGNLFEEIIVRVEEKAEPWAEVVHVQPASPRPFHVLHAVVKGECQFLQRGRTGLANVISADRNGIEARGELCAEFKSINYQPHGRRRWVDVFLLRNVFLENVVLNRARNVRPVSSLFFCNNQVHGPQHRRRRVDGHGNCSLLQIDSVEENLHILERIDGHAALADLALTGRMIRIVAHQRRQVEGNGQTSTAVFE